MTEVAATTFRSLGFMTYPAAPWQMYGEGWMSLFRVRREQSRPKGIYAVMMVRYDEPSPLTYHELLVARMVDKKFVTITDIWVDSVESMQGGRELWAIPKDLCDFGIEVRENPISTRMRATASVASQAIASCSFYDLAGALPRVGFTGSTKQTNTQGHDVFAQLTGSAKAAPCRGTWQFAANGPLGWLHGRRPLMSSRMRTFEMKFG